MDKGAAKPQPRYNLANAKVMLVEPNPHAMDILSQIFAGFGVRNPYRCTNAEEAIAVAKKSELDLIVSEANLEGKDGYEFVRWLRRTDLDPNRFCAVILVSGHTPLSKVESARACGANYILSKPLTPKAIIDRIVWVSLQNRAFIECDTYVGPDRRFHSIGPPPNTEGRRSTDLPLEIGDAEDPNMSQDDIDALLRPKVTKAPSSKI